MLSRPIVRSALLLFALGVACKGGEANTESDTLAMTDATVTLSAGTSSSTSTTATATASDTSTSTTETGTTDASGSGSDSDSSTGSTTDETTGGGICTPTVCESEGKVLACGDCQDNDSDGLVDLADPECISPCDDNEETFATGLPGDNMDPCKQDCFFDGNSGGGKGDCSWDLKCDPMSPGGDKCPYDPDFNNCPMEQSQECVEGCVTPNGCDCFGCCTVTVDGTDYDIYLGDETCKVAAIDSCETCTKNQDCDEDCDPEQCEVCFGQTEPPPGCEEPSCDNEMQPCKIDKEGNHDCPEGFFCSTGCCWALIPG